MHYEVQEFSRQKTLLAVGKNYFMQLSLIITALYTLYVLKVGEEVFNHLRFLPVIKPEYNKCSYDLREKRLSQLYSSFLPQSETVKTLLGGHPTAFQLTCICARYVSA